jgi:hypothetical protein
MAQAWGLPLLDLENHEAHRRITSWTMRRASGSHWGTSQCLQSATLARTRSICHTPQGCTLVTVQMPARYDSVKKTSLPANPAAVTVSLSTSPLSHITSEIDAGLRSTRLLSQLEVVCQIVIDVYKRLPHAIWALDIALRSVFLVLKY